MQDVRIAYTPRIWAKRLLHEIVGIGKRFIVMVIHRRGGKTVATLNHLNRDACRNRDHRYAYVAPLRNQAKRIAWGILKKITISIPGIRYNEAELTVYYPNGSELSLFGADNPDALRGIGLNGCALDEYAQMSPIVFSEIITKCVADRLGYVIILGTPKGKGHFHRIYQAAKMDPKMWAAVFLDIDQSLTQEKGKTIENLRTALADDRKLVDLGIMTQEEFDQEWYLSWEAALKGAVYAKQIAKARKDGRIGKIAYDAELLVHTVHDLGIGDAHSIGFFQKPSPREIRLIDYYENTGMGYPEIAKVIKNKPYVYGRHYFPFDIRNREQSTGLTRLATMEKLFGKDRVDVVPKISEEDGIDLGRAMWARLWVDDTLTEGQGGGLFVDLIGSHIYDYDEKRDVFRPKTKHDFASHCGAMFRYAATVEKEMLAFGNRLEEDKIARTKPRDRVEDEYKGDLGPKWEDDEDNPGPTEDELARM
jgi:phage terminase large subunit